MKRMKRTALEAGIPRRRRLICCFFMIGFLLALFALPAEALPSASGGNRKDSAVPAEGQDRLAELDGILPEGVAEEYRAASSPQELVGFEHLFSVLLDGVRGAGGGALKILFTLMGMITLGALAGFMEDGSSDGMKKALHALVGVVCALSFYMTLRASLARAETYLSDLMKFTEGLAPIMGGILVAGGAASAGAVATASLSGLLLMFQKLCVGVLTPLAGTCFAFSMLGGLSEEIRVDGIAKNLRAIYMTTVGVMCTVAGAAFSMQTLLAVSGDTVAMKTARYAVGNMIPIVGSTVGASLGTLGASLSMVKNTVGVGAVAVILLLTIPQLAELLLARLAVNLAGAYARMTGFTAGEKMLGELRGIFDMILAVTAFTAVTFILFLGVFLKTVLPSAG